MRSSPGKSKRETVSYALRWEGRDVPVQLIRESRKTARIAIGSRSFLLRLPHRLSEAQVREAKAWAEEWMDQQLRRDPRLAQKLCRRTYRSGQWLELATARYQLRIRREDRRGLSGRLLDDQLELYLPAEAPDEEVARLVSRLLARAHLPEVRERVHRWNDRHFQQAIGEVKLKYTRSRWGSCSSRRNINLSTRLLFAPQRVLDYVIVHELAHLVEMNHSSRFWALVAEVMPDYPEQERMLKAHQHLWDF
jgi:hypothetical protein